MPAIGLCAVASVPKTSVSAGLAKARRMAGAVLSGLAVESVSLRRVSSPCWTVHFVFSFQIPASGQGTRHFQTPAEEVKG